jgi:hypothetical protein
MKQLILESIIQRNGGKIKIPLWKLNLNANEYDALKDELRTAYNVGCLGCYPKEAALFYAEWWRREYNGGTPSKERVASSIGINDYELLFQLAKNAMHNWKCKVYGVNRHMYFYSLLLQGGLPMKQIQSSWGNYTTFLERAMTELVSMGITNWEDSSVFDELDCVRYLPQSFRNDCIYSISMQVIRCIVEDKNEILPYDIKEEKFKNLNKDLHNAYSQRRRSNPLAFFWYLKLNGGKGRLLYKLNTLNEIRSDVLLIDPSVYRFELHVAGKFLARYARVEHNEDYSVYTCINKEYLLQEWKGEQFIPVQIIMDNGEDRLITVSNCYAPDFSMPQKFIKNGENYVQHGTSDKNNIIIFNNEWDAKGGSVVNEIELNGKSYFYSVFSDSIQLENSENGEYVTYDNNFSSYHAEYRYNVASWCLNCTENFLTGIPSISVFNDNGECVSHDVEKYYRQKSQKGEWHPLRELENNLPSAIQIRVKFPDGKDEIRSFFYLKDLKYSTTEETLYDADIQWKCSRNVHISCMDTDGVDTTDKGNGCFHLHRKEECNIFPSVSQFVIFMPSYPPTKIVISSPFKGLAILDSDGKEISDNEMLCAQNLYNYNIFAQSIGEITIRMTYISDDIEDRKSLIIQRPSNGLMLLSDINDLLDRLFMLYERRAFNRESFIRVSVKGRFGGYKKVCRVRRYSLDTKSICDEECMVMEIDENPDDEIFTLPKDYDGHLMACSVGGGSKEMDVYTMERSEDKTRFRFPKLGNTNQFIVFSDKYDTGRVIPRYYNLDKLDMTQKQRNEIRGTRLSEYEKNLVPSSLESDIWIEIFRSYKVVTENNLIFSTFDCFIIIAHNPYLIAKFVLGLCYHGYSDNSISDFNRYAGEFAFSLHWIRPEYWMQVLNLINNLDEMAQHYLVNDVRKFITDVLKTELYQQKANEFAAYLMSGDIKKENPFYRTDLRDYKESIHGISDTGKDLPLVKIILNDYVFPVFSQDAQPWQKVAMLCPVKIAELITSSNVFIDFWNDDNDNLRRVINFYRIYATKTYSTILMKAISIYQNK